jgi:hypothetical protein
MTTVTTTLRDHMADNFSRNLEQFDTNRNLKPDHENPSTRILEKNQLRELLKESKKRKKTWMEGENENLSKTSRASS